MESTAIEKPNMSFLVFESMFNSRTQETNLKSQFIYEHYFNFTFWPPLLAVLVNDKFKNKMLWKFRLDGENVSKASSEEKG